MAKRALAGVLLVLVAVAFAAAQRRNNPTFAIRGKVLLESGVAEHAEVHLEKTEGQVVAVAFTDISGGFEFPGLALGTYHLVIRQEGYVDVRQQVDSVAGVQVVTTTIFLNKEPFKIVETARNGTVDVADLNRNYPKKALQEFDEAQEENRKGNITKAEQHLDAALKIAPDFYSAHNLLGVIYQKLERYSNAEKEFHRAEELSPKSAQPLVNLGSLYIQQADASRSQGRRIVGRILDQALDALEAAVKLNPRSAVAYYLLGTANYKSAFNEEAEKNLKRAIELDSDGHVGPARLILANLYMRERNWSAAIEQMDAYLSENPKATNRAQVQETRSRAAKNLENPASQ
jgi:Tfp pilus assembly protein PilF